MMSMCVYIRQSYKELVSKLLSCTLKAMESQKLHDNQLANAVGSQAYFYIVRSISAALFYGR